MIELLNAAKVQASDDNDVRLCAHLPAEADTEALGAALAPLLRPHLNIWLLGNLGMGKTTLTRGLLRALGHEGKVKSPTYTLIEPYVVSRLDLYHFDFYRFTHAEEFLEAGLDEYFEGDGVRLVEWPDRAHPYLPAADLEVLLHVAPSGGRELSLRALSPEGQTCLNDFIAHTATRPPASPPS